MPFWSGAAYNYVKEVHPRYVLLNARVVNGLLLEQWDHDYVDTKHESRKHLLDEKHWETAKFTMLVFCPFDTTAGGYSKGMTFGDFYRGECSTDGRLCSFLSRSRTKLAQYKTAKKNDNPKNVVKSDATKEVKELRRKAENYFKGKIDLRLRLIFLLGFIDRSKIPKHQGPIQFVEGTKTQWTCELGILDGHQPNAIKNLRDAFPAFQDGDKDDFTSLVNYIRPHKAKPTHERLLKDKKMK